MKSIFNLALLFRIAIVTSLLIAFPAGDARADRRSFTNTYEYSTVPEGKTALELWSTQGRRTWDASSPQFYEQILEIEHGLTDHWDIAYYTVLSQVAGDETTSEPLHLDEVKLETRYRLGDRGEWPVDVLLYLELSKHFAESHYGIEGKVIVARDFDKLLVAVNAISEIVVGNDAAETEPELAFAAGASYEVHPKLRLGAETWGAREEGVNILSAGPAISAAPSSNLWVTVTAGFGLTDAADKFSARAIIGIEL
ncbi:hypothetical protein BH11MYX3_BH11MYX3_48460 [soil metagenome]